MKKTVPLFISNHLSRNVTSLKFENHFIRTKIRFFFLLERSLFGVEVQFGGNSGTMSCQIQLTCWPWRAPKPAVIARQASHENNGAALSRPAMKLLSGGGVLHFFCDFISRWNQVHFCLLYVDPHSPHGQLSTQVSMTLGFLYSFAWPQHKFYSAVLQLKPTVTPIPLTVSCLLAEGFLKVPFCTCLCTFNGFKYRQIILTLPIMNSWGYKKINEPGGATF